MLVDSMSRTQRIKQQGLLLEKDIEQDLYDDIIRNYYGLHNVIDSSDFSRAFRRMNHSVARITSKNRPASVMKKGVAKSKTLAGK